MTKAGSPVFASVMGRLNWLVLSLVGRSDTSPMRTNSPKRATRPFVRGAARSRRGVHETHRCRAGEFEALLEAGGVTIETLVGLEGLASVLAAPSLRETAADRSAHERAGVQALVDELRTDRTVVEVRTISEPYREAARAAQKDSLAAAVRGTARRLTAPTARSYLSVRERLSRMCPTHPNCLCARGGSQIG